MGIDAITIFIGQQNFMTISQGNYKEMKVWYSQKDASLIYKKSFHKRRKILDAQKTMEKLRGCLPVFLVNNKAGFDYYKQDQTRNPRTCCAIFFQKVLECSSNS